MEGNLRRIMVNRNISIPKTAALRTRAVTNDDVDADLAVSALVLEHGQHYSDCSGEDLRHGGGTNCDDEVPLLLAPLSNLELAFASGPPQG
jgi:hypothetical protein